MNFTWTITKMERFVADGFVTAVYYSVEAVDGAHSASTMGVVDFAKEDNINYVPYESLTQAQVVQWVQDKVGKASVEDSLKIAVEKLKGPTEFGLPW
jgi:hypothetical protein